MPQIIVQAHTPEGTPGAVPLAERPAPLARNDTDDQLAAEWLYAWAYNALRPPHDRLAARIANGAATGRRLEAIAARRSMILDDALTEDRGDASNDEEGVVDEESTKD
jgi:hypothetical protein